MPLIFSLVYAVWSVGQDLDSTLFGKTCPGCGKHMLKSE